MSKQKLTQWFPYTVNPKRVGVYERKYSQDGLTIHYCYWNGEFWGLFGHDPDDAEGWKDLPTSYLKKPWRGLSEQPK